MSSPKQRSEARNIDRAQWADYPAPRARMKACESTHFLVTFADGEIVRVSHPSDRRKPYNFGPASRIAATFWKGRRSRQWADDRSYEGEHRNKRRAQYERSLDAPSILRMKVFTSTENFWS